MYDPDHCLPSPAMIRRTRLIAFVSLLLFGCVLAAVLFITMRAPLKDDIAWLLYVAHRWLGGRELYIDLVEVNPPLIVWISAVPLGISNWLNFDPKPVAISMFIAAVLACAWWTATLLRTRGGLLANRLPVFALIGSALIILPGADLGQREHLLVAAFLPYLVLFARAMDRRKVPVAAAVAAGILAGLGCALKPRYCAVFVALECLALTRGLRPWRALPLAAAATLAGYAASVAIICPAYLQRAVPLALALYGATDVPILTLISDSAMLLVGEVVATGLLWLRRRSMSDYSLMLTLMVFAIASTGVCFIDGKDWFYHRLPATVATVLALGLWIASEVGQRRLTSFQPLAVACVAVLVFCASAVKRMEPDAMDALAQRGSTVDRLEQIIRDEHARTYVAFSEWIALGFPVVNNTGVSWASRFDSMWALKGEVWRAGFDPKADREWPIARWVAHDFIAGCPEIAVVDTRETTKYINVLSAADPAFARAWTRYRQIAAFDGLVVYKRGRGGCLDVWVAAEASSGVTTR